MTVPCEPRGGWRLEKRLDLGTLLSVASALVVVVALATNLKTRLDMLEDKLCAVTRRVEETQATAFKVERIEERIQSMQAVLVEIKDELKRREGR